MVIVYFGVELQLSITLVINLMLLVLAILI